MLIRPFYVRLPEDIGPSIVSLLRGAGVVNRDQSSGSTIKHVFVGRYGGGVNIQGMSHINRDMPVVSLAEFMHEVQRE